MKTKKVKHVQFTITPAKNDACEGWAKLNTVNISIPKNKFKTLDDVKKLWFEKTNCKAIKVVQGLEVELVQYV